MINPSRRPYNDFRPIFLTATLSKILESFYADWILDRIYHKLDPRQFEALPDITPYMPTLKRMERLCASSCLISARHSIE